MGQLPEGSVHLIQSVEDAEAFTPRDEQKIAYTTQTTLSVDDTKAIIAVLQRAISEACRAAQGRHLLCDDNRQEAVKQIAPSCDALIVVGAPNSSNSQRLVETAKRCGCNARYWSQRGDEIDIGRLGDPSGRSG